ncbi:hypothetical protein [Thiofilum flexile]|uniref:hypothetical protein n=1 Tax=Thiofilum flexile TaxID=125627 RepID=UPI000360CD4D|nr:hypothetical protein [Thiofilum flexile]
MDNLLVFAFLAMVGGLVWLHLNKHNPQKLNSVRHKTKGLGGLYVVEKVLLLAAGLMGSLFAYGIFSPIWEPLGYLVGAMVIAFNFSEGFLIRLTIAAWRYGFRLVGSIAAIGVLMIMWYSLTAGASVIETFLGKNQDLQLAAQYKIAASRDTIEAAKAGILTAQLKAREADHYGYLNNPDIAKAQANAATISAQENQRIAQVLENKAPEFKAAFGMSRDAVAFLVALALEFSILGVVIFTELFGKPTPLPALVRFANKSFDWNINPHHLNNLSIEKSPAPETVALPYSMPQVGFAGITAYASQPSREGFSTIPSEVSLASRDASPASHHTVSDRLTAPSPVYAVGETLADTGDTKLAPKPAQERVFNQWLELIKQGDISPTVRPAKTLIIENQLTVGVKLAEGLASDWLDRAYNLGVLALNPDYTNGRPKYILASQYKADRVELTKREAV